MPHHSALPRRTDRPWESSPSTVAQSLQLTRSGNPIGGHAAPAWSPDGRYIGFAVFDAGPSNGLWLLERQTGGVRMLHRRDGVYESLFAPDGSSIYIAGGDALITRLPFDAATGTVRRNAEIIPVPGVPGVRGLRSLATVRGWRLPDSV